MEQKKEFKPFDKLVIKKKGKETYWHCDLFSHEIADYIVTVGNYTYKKDDYYILPFEGNEHWIGLPFTKDELGELNIGDTIVAFDDEDKGINTKLLVDVTRLRSVSVDRICTEGGPIYKYCIPFSQFNPNDMEETKKHVLTVKDGKLVKVRV